MNIEPPKTQKELFERLNLICHHGPYQMAARYRGTGAPGVFLEDLLGLRTGNKDIPDSIGCELKYYTSKTTYLTLFHKEPQPRGIMHYMVSEFGQRDSLGRQSLRHLVPGKSDKFRVIADGGKIVIRPLKRAKELIAFWTIDDILSAVGGKLRRLICVKGERKGQEVSYTRIDFYENVQLTDFINEVVKGTVIIDFDVREMKPGSKGLRNHGTKFRVSPNDVARLYAKKARIS